MYKESKWGKFSSREDLKTLKYHRKQFSFRFWDKLHKKPIISPLKNMTLAVLKSCIQFLKNEKTWFNVYLECNANWIHKCKILMDDLKLTCKHTSTLLFIMQSSHTIPFIPQTLQKDSKWHIYIWSTHTAWQQHTFQFTQSKQRAFNSLLSLKGAAAKPDLLII